MEAAGDGAEEEGVQIALELIEAIKRKTRCAWHPPDGSRLGRDRTANNPGSWIGEGVWLKIDPTENI